MSRWNNSSSSKSSTFLALIRTMTSSKFGVTKSQGSFVIPRDPTPSHALPLSSIDRFLGKGSYAGMFLVYRYGQEPAKVIREALGKALVPYYPLAGRLVSSEDGDLQVVCTGYGAWFVEASADCSLEDVHWLEYPPLMIPMEELLPSPPNQVGIILMMQVTRFTCGGFVLGFVLDHAIADGIGVGQFHNAVGEMARGLDQPSVEPVWLRKDFPMSTLSPPTSPLVLRIPVEYFAVDFSTNHINQLKNQFMWRTGQRCSTFDVTIAKLWQCRTRAIGLETGVDIHLQFMVDARPFLGHVLPREGGYYGNCLYPAIVTARSDTISHASIPEIVTLIRNAKKRVTAEFSQWINGEADEKRTTVTIGYESMGVADWTKLGLNEVDFGWGTSYATPAPCERDWPPSPWCVIVRSRAQHQGSRLITRCVKKEHLEAFRDQVMNISSMSTINSKL